MRSYSEYLAGFFPGKKVQKISVNAGFSCPNRDGTIGTGGCSYCRNDSFSPAYCMERGSVAEQIEKGKIFFGRKYPGMKYLAYFQSYTNTYSDNLTKLEILYREALSCKDIVGIAVGTRPDTLPDGTLALLARLNAEKPVFLEIGAETSNNETLKRINRGHTWEQVADAVGRASQRGLHCGLHLIAGLPGEGKRMILETVEKAVSLPIETLKLHQLQILKGTPLYKKWKNGEADVVPFELDEYLELCTEIARIVPENIVIERFLSQSPPELVEAPKWGIKNYQFVNLLNNRLAETNIPPVENVEIEKSFNTKKNMTKTIIAGAFFAAAVAFNASADITVKLPANSGLDSISGMRTKLQMYVDAKSRAEQGFQPFAVAVENNKAVIQTTRGSEPEYIVVKVNDETNIPLVAAPDEQLTVNIKSLAPAEVEFSGTPLLEAMTEVDAVTNPILKRYRELAAAEEKDRDAMQAVIDEYTQAVKDYVEENITSPKSVYAITRLNGEDFVNAFNRLSEGAKTSVYYPIAQKINDQTQQMLEKERKQKELQDGTHDAPAFTLYDLEGKPVSLAQFKGKWVILDFWGSWCIWCIKGFPELKEAYAKYRDRLEIIGIDCNETEEAWKAGVKKHELPWVNVYCPKGNAILSEYGVQGFPTKAIVDPEGKIRNITVGHNPEFFNILNELLSK